MTQIDLPTSREQEQHHFILDVLHLFSLDETDCYSALFWRCEQPGTVSFFVNVNDTFHYSTADVERITPEDMSALRQAIADVRAITGRDSDNYDGMMLWAARKRKMRPLQGAYPDDRRLWALFDACGPVRTAEEEG